MQQMPGSALYVGRTQLTDCSGAVAGSQSGDRVGSRDLGSGGQGKEQIIVGILDRMDQESRLDLPVEDEEVVAGPERPLKLGTRLFPLRRRRQSATRWHQTRAILGWGEMSK